MDNQSSSSSGADDQERPQLGGYTTLNAYSLYPTTVPPFVLNSQFQKLKLKDTHKGLPMTNSEEYHKDPILLNSGIDHKWGTFARNIGSNVAYSSEQRASIPKDEESMAGSIGTSSSSSDTSIKLKSKEEVLADLSGQWGGEERLKQLFDTPVMQNYEFKNEKDRNDWYDYIARVKQFYYAPQKDGTENLDTRPGHSNIVNNHNNNSNNRRSAFFMKQSNDWLEELNRDRERWKRLKQKKLQQWRPRLTRLLLDSQYLPLAFRIIIGILCVISLGLAVRIFQNSRENITQNNGESLQQQPSTIMAICVNAIAIVYIFYIAWDEFHGKPLGLRNPLSKLRLILLDLLFIIFTSSNLALAFNTLYDTKWVCQSDDLSDLFLPDISSTSGNGSTTPFVSPAAAHNFYPKLSYICKKQKALSAFLFMVVSMWVITFAVTIIRVVERVSSSSPRPMDM